jgi:hypothetical protein
MSAPSHSRRHNRRVRGPRCNRDGCSLLDREPATLEKVCQEAGHGPVSNEAWSSLVEIADLWSHYVMVRGKLTCA